MEHPLLLNISVLFEVNELRGTFIFKMGICRAYE